MVETIEWTESGGVMIDQTRLTPEQQFGASPGYQKAAEALRARGSRAGQALGVGAIMGVALGVQEDADFETVCATLAQTRPPAVNLFWAIDRMRRMHVSLSGGLNGGPRA